MSCRGLTRRQFLWTSGCAASVLTGAGIGEADLLALPVSMASGAGSGSERRYPVPSKDGVTVDHDAYVMLVRFRGKVFSLALACPHENAAVKWVAKDQRFQCSKHDSQYQPDGVHVEGRATRNMDRLAIRRDGDAVVVSLSKLYKSDTDPAGWAAAAIDV